MTPRQRLLPTFFFAGFECTCHVDRSGLRRDYVAITRHDRHAREDYRRVAELGLGIVREGVRWPRCDRGDGRYDFDSFAAMLDAAAEVGVRQITGLFHFGYPAGLDPLHPSFVSRFVAFAAAFARWRRARTDGVNVYVPIHEPSKFSIAAGDAGWFAPFADGRAAAIKRTLVRAAVGATDAIRAEDPSARFIAIDPVLHVAAPPDDPGAAGEAAAQNAAQFEAWDMLAGRLAPELGGGPGYLDVIGVDCYPDQQRELGRDDQLPLDDPRRRAFGDVLRELGARYDRPLVVAEMGARGDERPDWVETIVDECLAAMRDGVDLQGIGLYPFVDIPEWKHGRLGPLGRLGVLDVVERDGDLARVWNEPYRGAFERASRRAASSGLLPHP